MLCCLYCPLFVTVGIRAKPRSQVRNRGTFVCNHPLIYLYPFPPIAPKFLYLPLFNSAAKKYFLGRKNIGAAFATPCPPPPNLILWVQAPTPCVTMQKFRHIWRYCGTLNRNRNLFQKSTFRILCESPALRCMLQDPRVHKQ